MKKEYCAPEVGKVSFQSQNELAAGPGGSVTVEPWPESDTDTQSIFNDNNTITHG